MRYFNLHTHKNEHSERVISLVNQYPLDYQREIPIFSIGIHPWKIDQDRVWDEFQIIKKEVNNPSCWAVGECGLDKRIECPMELQIEVFKAQLLLAETHQKPVIIHCVAAYQELIAIKKEMQTTIPLVIHGFSKNWDIAKQLLDNDFYLSFGKYLIQNPNLAGVFKQVPNDRFFLETDNMNEDIAFVYEKAAFYKQIDLLALQNQIENNIETVFKKKIAGL